MASSNAPLAYAELAPHSIHLAVLSGRKVVALRAFSLDAKADIAAFVAEHGLAGAVRASLLASANFLHRSADAESGAMRQPAALQNHLARQSLGFDGVPVGAVCDAATGAAIDPVRAAPWVLAAVDGAAFSAAKDQLGALGLAPAELILAAPAYLGVVAGSLSGDDVALVLIPGADEARLAWVSAAGVQAIASAPVGYAKVFESVQRGLGLKFKAAAGKLFYNDNYDFTDAAPKIAADFADALKPALAATPATSLYIAGLTPGQAWLGEGVASVLGLKVCSPGGAELIGRLGLEVGAVAVPSSAAALVAVAAAGSADAAWVQPTLDTLLSRPKSAAPAAKPAVAAAAPAAEEPAPSPAPAPVVAPKASAAAKSAAVPAAKPVAKPAPAPAQKPAPKAAPQPVVAVAVEEVEAPAEPVRPAAPAPVRRSGNKGPIFIAAGVGVIATVVGLAVHFRSPRDRADSPASAAPAQVAPAQPAAPSVEAPKPAAPAPAPTPAPTPVPAQADDRYASDPRRFGNDRYRLEVTEKGFIQGLATVRDEVLVEAAAGISLQGSYVGTDGRRKWFNVGGVDDAGYQATVKKSVKDGATVFDVKVTHPRFEMEQSFRCLPDAIKVSAKFTPINLRDPRGVIAAVHSVRLSPVALNPSLRMRSSVDSFAYSMKAGLLNVVFDNTAWARDGAEGKQTIVAGENGVSFLHFGEGSGGSTNLNYSIVMP